MTLQDILLVKGSAVYSVPPGTSLDEASKQLVKFRVGALLVIDDAAIEPQMLGIITERDLLYAQVSRPGTFGETPVSDVMSSPVITGAPDDSIEAIMALMTTKRIRHLPVLSEGRLAGIISIGDVVKAEMHRLAMENQVMRDYIRS